MKNFFCLLGTGATFIAMLCLMLVILSPMAYGQFMLVQSSGSFGGCDDSPENPTVILAGLGGVAFIGNDLRRRRSRAKATKASKQQAAIKTIDPRIVP